MGAKGPPVDLNRTVGEAVDRSRLAAETKHIEIRVGGRIDVPVFDEGAKEPRHARGVVAEAPGLYFVGLFYLYAASSGIFRGVGRDAGYVVDRLVERAAER